MGSVKRSIERIAGAWRFARTHGQHLPLAFRAVLLMTCTVTLLRGTLKSTDRSLTVLYVGRRLNYPYLLRTVFDQWQVVEEVQTTLLTYGRHKRRVERLADVTIIDIGWPYHYRINRHGRYLEIPDWVNMALPLQGEWNDTVAAFRYTARHNDLRRIRRIGYECRETRDRRDLEQFYDEMYLPFIQHRHSADAVKASRRHVLRRAAKGCLLQVVREGDVVAAGVVYPERSDLHFLWMGMPACHLEQPPAAAISALYYFGIRYAFDRGLAAVDFAGTRPFLNVGALPFKRKWGAFVEDTFSPSSFLLGLRGNCEASAHFLHRFPLLARRDGGLEAVCLVRDEPADRATIERIDKQYACDGITGLTVIDIAGDAPETATRAGGSASRVRHIRTDLASFAEHCSRDAVIDERRAARADVDRAVAQNLVELPGADIRLDKPLRARHRLLDTGLFSDDRLLEIFDRHDPDELLVYRMGDDHRQLDDFRYGSRGKLSAVQLLEAVRSGKLWLNILNLMENHPQFHVLVNAIYDELQAKLPEFRTIHRSANLLVSSPSSQVYFHADAPLNMLWHLRGEKRVWVYPGDERFAPHEWVEMIFTRESDDDLPYKPEFDAYATAYELKPGDMLTWPQNVPHRVENMSGLNVSLTTEHYTPQAMKKRMTYLSNHYLRAWFGWPTTNVALDGPGAVAKRTAFRIARRLPWLHEAASQADDAGFTLDR